MKWFKGLWLRLWPSKGWLPMEQVGEMETDTEVLLPPPPLVSRVGVEGGAGGGTCGIV